MEYVFYKIYVKQVIISEAPFPFFYCPKNFLEGIVLAASVFLNHRKQQPNGSQANFNTRWRGGMTQTLLKRSIIRHSVCLPSWKKPVFARLWVI